MVNWDRNPYAVHYLGIFFTGVSLFAGLFYYCSRIIIENTNSVTTFELNPSSPQVGRLCPVVLFISDASKKTGKISTGISQGFYYMFQLFLELNMPL